MKTIYSNIIDNTTNSKGKVLYTITTSNGLFYVGISEKGTTRPLKHYTKGVNNFINKTFRKTYKNGEIVGTRPSWRDLHEKLNECILNGDEITLTMKNIECDTREELCKMERETLKEMMIEKGVTNTLNKEYVSSIKKEL